MRLVKILTSVIEMNDNLIYVDRFEYKNRIVDQYVDESHVNFILMRFFYLKKHT